VIIIIIIQHKNDKERLKKEYLRRLRLFLRTDLSAKNKIEATGSLAVPVLRYLLLLLLLLLLLFYSCVFVVKWRSPSAQEMKAIYPSTLPIMCAVFIIIIIIFMRFIFTAYPTKYSNNSSTCNVPQCPQNFQSSNVTVN